MHMWATYYLHKSERRQCMEAVDFLGWFEWSCFQTYTKKGASMWICVVKKHVYKKKKKKRNEQHIALPLLHLHLECLLVSQLSMVCTPKHITNTCTFELKFWRLRLGLTVAKALNAKLMQMGELWSWDLRTTLAGHFPSVHPSSPSRMAPGHWGSTGCLCSTWHDELPVRFAGCCVILWY